MKRIETTLALHRSGRTTHRLAPLAAALIDTTQSLGFRRLGVTLIAGALAATSLLPAVATAAYITSSTLTPTGGIEIDEGGSVSFGASFSWWPESSYRQYTPRFLFGNGQYYNVVGYGNQFGRTQSMSFYDAYYDSIQGTFINFSDGIGGHSGSTTNSSTAFSWQYADDGQYVVNASYLLNYARTWNGNSCQYAWANYSSGDAWCTNNSSYNYSGYYQASSTRSSTVTVRNVAPTITSMMAPSTIAAFESFQFSAAATDPGLHDVLQFSWDLDGDGIFGDASGSAGSTSYTAGGLRSIGLRVIDGDGGVATMHRDILVADPVGVPAPKSVALIAIGMLVFFGTATLMRRRNR
jgi:hypothetical protein